jgi:hypothetical protein
MCLLHRFDSPPCCGFGNPRSGADARIGTPPVPKVFSMERGTPIPQKRERGGSDVVMAQLLRRSFHLSDQLRPVFADAVRTFSITRSVKARCLSDRMALPNL